MSKPRQDKYTRFVRGRPCQIRIPGYCKAAPENETTVPCHLNGAGMALKHASIHIAAGCDVCHDIVDGRKQTEYSDCDIERWHLEGVIRTQILMIEDGTLKL